MEKHSNIINSAIIFVGLVFLGFSIIFAANTLKPKEEARYQVVQLSEYVFAINDTQTNKIYYSSILSNGGTATWQEIVMPK